MDVVALKKYERTFMADSSETRYRFLRQSFLTISALTVCLVLWIAAMFVILTYYNWSTSTNVRSMPAQLWGLYALLSANPVYKSFRIWLLQTIVFYGAFVGIICWGVRSYLKCSVRNNPGSSSVHVFVPTCGIPVLGQDHKLRELLLYSWIGWCGLLVWGWLFYSYRYEFALWRVRSVFSSDFTDEQIMGWMLYDVVSEFGFAISYVSYNYFITSLHIFMIGYIPLLHNKATYGLE
jgi:hypothetical protein